jgi:parvulin-like peptidyl-prolyl isomerase
MKKTAKKLKKFARKPRFAKAKRLAKKHIPMPAEVEPLADAPVPRITNDTIAEHREEVIGGARKYIYPLSHTKRRIVIITSSLVIAVVVGFFTYCALALYRFKSNTGLLYGVTQVIPFPVAKAGSRYVAYENYLFELRHYQHYYETQQMVDFTSEAGKQQLEAYKKRALDNVINNAYVAELADKHKVSVSSREVEDTITILRNQNRLGASERGFEDVLRDNFGWSLSDFKRSLRQQLLAQKVVAALDKETNDRANAALAEINSGADFAAVAAKYSDDAATKDKGGEFGALIDKSTQDVPAQATDALYKLKPGQASGIINTGFSLEIVKLLEAQGDKVKAAHISFTYKDIGTYVNDLKAKEKTRAFIKL